MIELKLTKLQAAVLNQLDYVSYSVGDHYPDRDSELYSTLQDIVNHGVDAGYVGFTYYADTRRFALDNWADIIDLARVQAHDLGVGSLCELIAGFNYLGGISVAEVVDVLMEPSCDNKLYTQVLNALAWFALEETARAIVEGVDNDA